jgi:hypothetical protein
MTTSKSPNAVAKIAYETAKRSLPSYRHKFSPQKFTQPQLAALLILKEFFTTDYRGIVEIIKDSSDLRNILDLSIVPHYTTLQKASREILRKRQVKRLLKETIRLAEEVGILDETTKLSAMDSTGMESGHSSRYFIKRKAKGETDQYQKTTYKRFPKLALACETLTHLVTGALGMRGPSPDVVHFKKLTQEMLENHEPDTLLADAGYDSEESHRFLREDKGLHSIIPPKIGRPTKKLPKGKYRREMATNFDRETYGQRWQSETVMSMIKRNLREEVFAKSYHAQIREMMLKVLTHNVSIV